jgi:hypothetical protein
VTRAIRKADNWKFWVGIAYFGLVVTVVWLFFLNQKQSHVSAKQARDEAVRIAESDAAAKSQRAQCVASIPTLTKINSFVHGVQTLHSVLAQNSKAVLDATPKDDPDYRVRKANWLRVKGTLTAVSGIHFPVPTKKQCLSAVGRGNVR